MNLAIIYISDNLCREETVLKTNGVNTFKVSSIKDISVLSKQSMITKTIIRGKKLNESEYIRVFSMLEKLNFYLINSPETYELHNNSEFNYLMLKDYSPKSIFLKKNIKILDIKQEIESSKLTLPLFVRADSESAFKYVGIEGCLIKEKTDTQIKKCVQNIEEHIKEYSKIIIKEVKELRKNNLGINYEYRAIVIDSKIIMYDYNNELPSPKSINIDESIKKIIQNIRKKGFNGAYFMDFALTVDGEIIIVESKDIIKGSINNLDLFANGLLKL